MKKLIFSFTFLFLMGSFFQAFTKAPEYVGVKKCKTCHSSKAKGAQYKVWKKMAHSKTYKNLGTDKAKKVALSKGLKTDPQKSPKCLKCHTTAYDPKTGKKRKNTKSTLTLEEGISCESCHGPGSLYKSNKIMKDHEKFIKIGGIIPVKETCIKCHNPESPSFKKFNFKERMKKIAHPRPKKK